MKTNINLNWNFKNVEDKEWKIVDLPHDAMLFEERDPNCHNGVNSGYFPGGKYIYQKTLTFSEEDLAKNIYVFFEGVYQNCKVYLNCIQVGAHKYGFTEFKVNLTENALVGDNILRVDVDNSLEPNCRWYTGSGIYRDVYLIVEKKKAPNLLKIETISFDPAMISVTTESGCEIGITDSEGNLVMGQIMKENDNESSNLVNYLITIPNAKLWSADYPYLYTCQVTRGGEELSSTFGIRKLEWSAQKGLLINGERVLLRGGCIHHDNGVLGACAYADAEERRVRILKEAGYNAIRSAHNPMSRAMLDACDRLGMYVIDECFDGWYTPKTYHDYSRYFNECWRDDLKTMVEKDFNHPCVIMYSIGNEVLETSTDKGVETCRILKDYVNDLDSSRPITAGINVLLNVYAQNGIGIYKEKGNYEPKPLPPKKRGYKEKLSGSAFFNMMAGKLGGLMFYISSGKKGDKATKGAAEVLDIIGLNYAGSRFGYDLKKYPNRIMVASETMVTDLPYNWSHIKEYPAIIGDFVWAAWDYLGEAGVGAWMYHSYPGLPILAGSGTIDITGEITAEAYYEQIIWGLRKKPYIGVRPLNHTGETPKKSPWRFTNAIDSWSWLGYEGQMATIDVFASGRAVRLELNGKVIGTKPLKKYKTVFKVPYEQGTITAISLDEAGQEIFRYSLTSGDQDMKLLMVPEQKSIVANGQSLCFIPMTFTDGKGNRIPYVEEKLVIEVSGPGRLIGLGSAIVKTNESYVDNKTRSYRGRALAVIRSTRSSGNIIIKAKSESGLIAEISIMAV